LLLQSIEFCDQIIEALSKIAPEEPKKKKNRALEKPVHQIPAGKYIDRAKDHLTCGDRTYKL
jgi:hypothetical protein